MSKVGSSGEVRRGYAGMVVNLDGRQERLKEIINNTHGSIEKLQRELSEKDKQLKEKQNEILKLRVEIEESGTY